MHAINTRGYSELLPGKK